MDRWLKENLDGIPYFINKKYDVVGIVSGNGKVRLGKMLPLGSGILMHDGVWEKIENINIGDKVISPAVDGKSSQIVNVIDKVDHKNLEMCEIRNSRDNSLLYTCCVEHNVPVRTLWIKRSKNKKEYIWKDEIYQAGDLANKNETWFKNHCPKIITSPIINKFNKEDYKINPYLLGLYLGDGGIVSKNRIQITNPDLNIIFWLEKNTKLESKYLKKGTQCYDLRINQESNDFLECGIGAHNKKIPKEVLTSCYEYRKKVFEGLLDTDAYIDPNGYVVYTTASEKLAYDVQSLVKTLGCRASIHLIHKHCQSFKDGEKRKYYNVHINLGEISIKLNLLRDRKNRLLKIDLNNETNKNSQFESINVFKISERMDGCCIQVDGSSNLYITDNYVVTHNSTLAMQSAYYIAWILAGGKTILDENGKVLEIIRPKRKVNFGLDHVVFAPEDLKKKAHQLPPNSVIVYDEGRAGLDSSRSMESVNKGMQDFFQECGVYGHTILIVLPDFFQLHRTYAVNRSLFLINVFADNQFNRGYFSFYNDHQKELLYHWGKKKVGANFQYAAAKRNFWGRFSDWLPFDKDTYENLKKSALEKKRLGPKEIKELSQTALLIFLIKNKMRLSFDYLDKALLPIKEKYPKMYFSKDALARLYLQGKYVYDHGEFKTEDEMNEIYKNKFEEVCQKELDEERKIMEYNSKRSVINIDTKKWFNYDQVPEEDPKFWKERLIQLENKLKGASLSERGIRETIEEDDYLENDQ
jgi:hypothetical protein